MLRALRETRRMVKERMKDGKSRGPKSAVNDGLKIFKSIALFVGTTVLSNLLGVWAGPVDPFVLSVLDLVSGYACLRVLFFTVRHPLLRLLLRAQPWALPQNPPLATALWEAALALLQPANASTAFLERAMPRLPGHGPTLTFGQYLNTLEATASPSVLKTAAASTQELLRLRPQTLDQDVLRCAKEEGSDWAWACTWKESLVHDDAHLLGRCYYLLDRRILPEGAQGKQAVRAAVLTMRLLDFMKRVGNGSIPCRGFMSRAHPVPKIVPRCVQAFETLFATSIEPQGTTGATVHRRSFESCSHHIIVLCHGQAVEVPVRDASGARVSEGQLAKLLVTAEASAKRRNAARQEDRMWPLDTLAWLPWHEWGEAVSLVTLDQGVKFNDDKSSIPTSSRATRAIEKMWTAALVVALDSSLPSWPQTRDSLSSRALSLLLGSTAASQGTGRWRSGAFCLVVQPDGYAGLCCTLPLAEPWAVTQMWEYALAKERYPISHAEADADLGGAAPTCMRTSELGAGAAGAAAMRLRVDAARSAFAREALGVSLRVLCVQDVGWRVLQELKVAPAAAIHIAAHIAQCRVVGARRTSQALHSVPTRLFFRGRSDWVCTTKSAADAVSAFCKGMSKASAATETARERAEARSAKRALLIEACKAVDHLQREAALGNGFYRFLLALRGSCTHRRGAALLQALVPLRQDSADGVPPAALCTWLCEVQMDPKTPADALSLGGGGGFAMPAMARGCHIGVAPVGDARLVLHVYCSHSVSAQKPALATAPVRSSTSPDADSDEFVNCEEEAMEHQQDSGSASAGLTGEERESFSTNSTAGAAGQNDARRVLRSVHSVSADAVAQEMEQVLQELVELLRHAA